MPMRAERDIVMANLSVVKLFHRLVGHDPTRLPPLQNTEGNSSVGALSAWRAENLQFLTEIAVYLGHDTR